MMRHLVAHHVGLFQHLGRKRIGAVRGGLVEDDRQRRLDGVGEIADMGAGALDDFAVGVDQRIGLARQRRDFDGNSPSSRSAWPERMSAIDSEMRLSGARPKRT